MSKTKELFSSIREEEIMEEFSQDRIFMTSDIEEAVASLEEERKKEIGKIIVIEGEEIETLPF